MKKLLLVVTVIFALAIAGCSSGGGGGTTPPTPPTTHPYEGTWSGELSINPTMFFASKDDYDCLDANKILIVSLVVDGDGNVSGRIHFQGVFQPSGNTGTIGGIIYGYISSSGDISGGITMDVVCHINDVTFIGNINSNILNIRFSNDGRTFTVPVSRS